MDRLFISLFVITVLVLLGVFISWIVKPKASYISNSKSNKNCIFIVNDDCRMLEYSVRRLASGRYLPHCDFENILLFTDNISDEMKMMCEMLSKDYSYVRIIDKAKLDDYF